MDRALEALLHHINALLKGYEVSKDERYRTAALHASYETSNSVMDEQLNKW